MDFQGDAIHGLHSGPARTCQGSGGISQGVKGDRDIMGIQWGYNGDILVTIKNWRFKTFNHQQWWQSGRLNIKPSKVQFLATNIGICPQKIAAWKQRQIEVLTRRNPAAKKTWGFEPTKQNLGRHYQWSDGCVWWGVPRTLQVSWQGCSKLLDFCDTLFSDTQKNVFLITMGSLITRPLNGGLPIYGH